MPYKRKLPTLETKLKQVAGGINTTTKAQRKKIDKTKFDISLPRVQYSDIYMYLKKSWHYKGKSCMLCGSLMNDPYVLEHHHYVCEINKQKQRKSFDD